VTDAAQGEAGFSLGPLNWRIEAGQLIVPSQKRKDLKMSAKGIVIPADGRRRFDGLMLGGRFDLKLVGCDTADSITLFEEICPVGRKRLYHLHRESDEVAWVVAGEFSFKIGDEVTTGGPGTCAFMPRGVTHAWKNIGKDTGRLVALYTPATAGGYIEELLEEGRPQTPEERKALADRHHWEIVGSNPL
jgi:mannose-6-phosphate isomerase-like protein (cupin superfamily)